MAHVTTVVPESTAKFLEDYCYKNRVSRSKLVSGLIERWAEELEEDKCRKEECLATDDELREAVVAGVVSAEEVGLR